MLRRMPASAPIQKRANSALTKPRSRRYREARAAVASSRSLQQAINKSELLDGLSADHRKEARHILRGLPAYVDEGLLGSLKAALKAGKVIHFSWGQHPTGGYDYSVSTDVDGTVQLGLRTPPGNSSA
jgi:hypothetical protein